jgi:hypothetical protein
MWQAGFYELDTMNQIELPSWRNRAKAEVQEAGYSPAPKRILDATIRISRFFTTQIYSPTRRNSIRSRTFDVLAGRALNNG